MRTEGKSPCFSCERRDLDKRECAIKCKKLHAFQHSLNMTFVSGAGSSFIETQSVHHGHRIAHRGAD